jgi:hypothetical protein
LAEGPYSSYRDKYDYLEELEKLRTINTRKWLYQARSPYLDK